MRTLYFQLVSSRPGFWITHIWFYGLPLAREEYFARPSFWVGLVYVTFPLGHLLYAWNDLGDAETDRLNPRKGGLLFGGRGSDAQLAALPQWIVGVQVVSLGPVFWYGGARMALWLLLALLVNALYNAPSISLKSVPGLDLLAQSGYLLVFLFSSWINDAPHLPLATLVFSAMFAMHSHLFGQIMDLEPDREAGRTTTAVRLGVLPSKALLVSLLCAEAVIIWSAYRDPWVTAFLVASAVVFCADALFLFRNRPYPKWAIVAAFVAWNVAAAASVHFMWARGTLAGF